MAISRDISEKIKDLLQGHPEGLSITDIVKILPINRNTASRYLDTLLVTGQVEMRHFGMAKLYSPAKRLPVSSVLSLSSEYIMQIDHGLRIVFINRPFLELLGLAERDIMGKKIDFSRIPAIFDEEYPLLLRWISEGLSGVERQGEIRLDSRGRILGCRIAPAVFSDGQRGISVIFEDITARRHDEIRLRESEERYRTLVEISPDAIILHRNGTVIYANPAAFRLIGASCAEEIIGKDILVFVKPEYRDAVRRNIRKDLKGQVTPTLETEMVRVDGVPIIIEGRGVRTFLDGEPAVQVTMRDVTRRKQAEIALQKSEARLKSIVRVAPVGIGLVVGRVFREVNERFCTMIGYTSNELIGKSARMLYFTNAEFDHIGAELYGKMKREGSWSIETRWMRKTGDAIDILLSVTPLDPHDPSAGEIFTALDITRRKRSEEAIRASEERYRHLLERSFNAVIVHKGGKIVVANEAALIIAGATSPEDLIGKDIAAFIHPNSRSIVHERVRSMLQAPGTTVPLVQETFLRLNGESFEVEVMATSFDDNGSPAIQIIFREVPETTTRETDR